MEDRVNAIPCFYNMKREAWNAGKLTGVDCKRLMNNHDDIINKVLQIFLDSNKGEVPDEEITNVTKTRDLLLQELDNVY